METASLIQLTACWDSAGALAGPFLRRVSPLHPEGLRGGYSTYHASLGGLSIGKLSFTFPLVEARVLMLSSGSGCSPMTSSPLISPRLWESRLTLLKVWRPSRPSGRCTCAGHLWRWWVVYAPNFPGSTTWLCEPPLACLFPCHSCALHTLSRDLQVWRRGYLPGYVCNPGSPRERDASLFPEGTGPYFRHPY